MVASSSKQPDIWAVQFVTFGAATVFIILRLISRRITKIALWWDDYFALCCYAMAIIWVGLIPWWVIKGLGLHIEDVTWISQEEALRSGKLILYIGELVYASALFFGKMSILCFYWRMFRVSNIKLPIQILMGASIIWIIIRTFMAIFHCVPVNAFWDANVENARCDIDDSKFFFGTILTHVVIDIAILVLPIMQIRKLQLPRLQKLGITAMFCFGIFICAAAMVIIIESTKFDASSVDLTWNLTVIIIWASVEVNLVTVSACMPTIRPAMMYMFTCVNPNASLGSGSNSYGNSYGRSNNTNKIRLSALRRPDDVDESSSTYQLADSVKGNGSVSDFETHALDHHRGIHTSITGAGPGDSREAVLGPKTISDGIVVSNETVVRVSKARPH